MALFLHIFIYTIDTPCCIRTLKRKSNTKTEKVKELRTNFGNRKLSFKYCLQFSKCFDPNVKNRENNG